jgi:hypothetical protein
MTAEIGILNRNGIALAADSAVTVNIEGREKVLNSAEKLFCLTTSHPVGIMIFGNGSLMGVPWEIVIKQYRKKVGLDCFSSLQEYCNDFFIEVIKDNRYYTNESINAYVYRTFVEHLDELLDHLGGSLQKEFPNYEPPKSDVLRVMYRVLYEKNAYLNTLPFAQGFDYRDIVFFKDNYELIVLECISKKINIPISEEIKKEFLNFASLIICKDIYRNYSGIVIAGYGDKDIFPELYQYNLEGIFNGKIKYKLLEHAKIYAEEANDKRTSAIIPFAQQEMVHSVLTGIDPYLREFILANMEGILSDLGNISNKILEENNGEAKLSIDDVELLNKSGVNAYNEIISRLNEIMSTFYMNPVHNMVSILPKNELASMAETLVNLTSFKRRITMDTETVGGPIDVAIISKTEGFIWIKRKYYFKPELNQHYLRSR